MLEFIIGLVFFVIGTAMYAGDQGLVALLKLKKGAIVNREKRFVASLIVGAIGAWIVWYAISHLFGFKTESLSDVGYFLIGWATMTLGLWLGSLSVPYYQKWRAGKVDPVKDFTSTVKKKGREIAVEVATTRSEKPEEKVTEVKTEVTTPVVTEPVVEKKVEETKIEEPQRELTFEERLEKFKKS